MVTASVAWTGSTNDLNLYLYDPIGRLVAKSEQRSTTTESVSYNAPTAGYYLVKVHAQTAFQPVSFAGDSNQPVQTAYTKAGTLGRGQSASVGVNPGGMGCVNVRLTWGWSFNAPTMSLYGPGGAKLSDASNFQDSWLAAYAHLNYAPAAPGAYTLNIDGASLTGTLSYKLITPYQL